jgi:hypothetical protein
MHLGDLGYRTTQARLLLEPWLFASYVFLFNHWPTYPLKPLCFFSLATQPAY